MFNDLFDLVHMLEHDYKEENGKQVHVFGCRRCAIALRLSSFKVQILHLLHDLDFDIGEPIDKNKRP